MALKHLRSSTANKRPLPSGLADGQLAINTEQTSPGLFFKNASGSLVKVGPVHVGATAPNATPASGGETGNTIGEQWLDTSGTNPVLKIWDGSGWASEAGEFVNASGDTMTGALVMDNQQQVRFRETTANGTNFIAIQAPASVSSDKTLTLPDVTGTLVSTGDTGTVTSTMIADGTIVDGDINAAAAIAGTKISPDFGSQNVVTTGTGTAASFIPTGSSVPTNGVYLPSANTVGVATNGTGRLFVDASGRVLAGVSSSSSNFRAVIEGNTGFAVPWGALLLSSTSTTPDVNDFLGGVAFSDASHVQAVQIVARRDGGTWASGSSQPSMLVFSTTSNGSAVPTERLRITSAGNVGIGTISPGGRLDIKAASAATPLIVQGPSSEFARIDSSGRLLVGTSSSSANGTITAQANPGSSIGGAVLLLQNGQSAATIGGGSADLGYIWFADNAGNLFADIRASADGTAGSGDYPGRLVFSTTADGASSPTERMRITNTGGVYIGANPAGGAFSATGAGFANDGRFNNTTDSQRVAYFNRLTNDGTIIEIAQGTTVEGTISVTGTTVSYNGAHLSRWSQIEGTTEHDSALRPEILRGTVLSNVDEMCEWIDPPTEAVLWAEGEELPEGVSVGDEKEPANPGGPQANEQLNRMKVSDLEGDPNVAGVFQGWDDDDDTYTNDFYCAMTGDFIIRIGAGVTVERGDLLMSAGDGTAKPQDDDIIRSKTIAKVTSTTVSCTYDDGSYCVPCVLMAC